MASTILCHSAMALITMMVMTTTMFCYVNAQAQAPVGVPVQSPMAMSGLAPGPAGTDCTTELYGMSDCLTYVEADSNLTKPDPACCPELTGLIKNHPLCLCLLLGNTSATFGIEIDINKAIQLPTACGVALPDISRCPATSPTGAPAEAPSATIGGAASSPGGLALGPGVAASPGSANANHGASVNRAAFGHALVAAAALTAFFWVLV